MSRALHIKWVSWIFVVGGPGVEFFAHRKEEVADLRIAGS
jgi:hypothetical protein